MRFLKLQNTFKQKLGRKAGRFYIGSSFFIRGSWSREQKAYLLVTNFQKNIYTCLISFPKAKEIRILKTKRLLGGPIADSKISRLKPILNDKKEIKGLGFEEYKPFFSRLRQQEKKQKKVSDQEIQLKDNILTKLLTLAIKGDSSSLAEKTAKELKEANEHYYGDKTGESPLSDEEWDKKLELMEHLDPEDTFQVRKTGTTYAEPDSREKVPLPYQIGSQDVVKPGTGALDKWVSKTKKSKSFVISRKQDGVNCQVIYKDGKLEQAYTKGRGGILGRSTLNKVMNISSVPKTIPYKKTFAANLELQLSDEIFETKYKKLGYTSPRNLTFGLINRDDASKDDLKDIQAFAFAILDPKGLDKDKQFSMLKKFGFTTVGYKTFPTSKISEEKLTRILKKAKKKTKFAMDGLVVEVNEANIRSQMEKEKGKSGLNPAFSRKFKISEEEDNVEVEVKKIVWDVSKQGLLKPRVMIADPVMLKGTRISFATGFNAEYIKKNKLGPGAIIKITKGGDIIPDIVDVIKGTSAQLPKLCPSSGDKLVWKRKELLCPNEECPARITKKSINFFQKMHMDFIGSASVATFEEAGYDTVEKILKLSVNDMLNLEGFQITKAKKLYTSIHDALIRGKEGKGVYLPQLMDASGFFQTLGQTRLKSIYEHYNGDILEWDGYSKQDLMEELINDIPGIGTVVAKVFAFGIGPFNSWLKRIKKYVIIKKYFKQIKKSGKLSGEKIVFTGFRNEDLVKRIEEMGGEYQPSINRETTILVLKEFKNSSKEQKARKAGIKLITIPELEKLLE